MGNLFNLASGLTALKGSNYRSTEFFITLCTLLASFVAGLTEVLPAETAITIGAVATALYAVARGISKWDKTKIRPGWGTTEWWAVLLVLVADFVTALSTDLSGEFATTIAAVVGGLYAISRGLAKKGTVGPEVV